MDPIELALWAAVFGLACATLWWSRPQPVELDWQRFFKLTLVTQLRGADQLQESDTEGWVRAGRERVWFEPAARKPFVKLISPDPARLDIPELVGERVLTAELAEVASPALRLPVLFSKGGDAGLYSNPMGLGQSFSLPQYLGAGVDWDALADWTPGVQEGLARKGKGTIWVCLEQPKLFLELDAILPCVHALGPADGLEEQAHAIDALGPELSDRFVLVVGGAATPRLLETLSSFDGLRDRVLAVVLLQPELERHQDWLAQHFTHLGMDTELNRVTGWFQLRFLSPDASDEEIVHVSHGITQPELPETDRAAVEIVELGLLPGGPETYPKELLARGLAITVLAWLGSRG